MTRVSAIGCIACLRMGLGETPAQIHHIREGRIARTDTLVLPLCASHHTGSSMSVHMDKERLMRALGVSSEFDLLGDVLRRIA